MVTKNQSKSPTTFCLLFTLFCFQSPADATPQSQGTTISPSGPYVVSSVYGHYTHIPADLQTKLKDSGCDGGDRLCQVRYSNGTTAFMSYRFNARTNAHDELSATYLVNAADKEVSAQYYAYNLVGSVQKSTLIHEVASSGARERDQGKRIKIMFKIIMLVCIFLESLKLFSRRMSLALKLQLFCLPFLLLRIFE